MAAHRRVVASARSLTHLRGALAHVLGSALRCTRPGSSRSCGGTVASAHPAPLHDRCHRPVPIRPRRGRPRPDPDHPDRRQAEGHRQGRPAPDVAPRWQSRAVRRAQPRPGARPHLRRRDRGPGRARLAQPPRLARIGGDRLVSRRARRPIARGAPLRRAAVRAAAARLRAARRRDGAGARRALVRDAPARRARPAARGRPLRRMRPGPRGRRAVPLGAAARRGPVPALSRAGARPDGHQPRVGEAPEGLSAPRHRGDRRPPPCARHRTRDRGRPARVRPGRARTRCPVAGVPRRGPGSPARPARPSVPS